MATLQLALTDADQALIAAFAGCSLDEKPGSNYVQDNGGLPQYVCEIARAVKKTGKTTSAAIAIAISRVRVWATGKGVDKDTQAKAAKAVAEYEKLLARTHAKTADKKAGKKVAASVDFDMSDAELVAAAAAVPPCNSFAVDQILLSITERPTALEQILALKSTGR